MDVNALRYGQSYTNNSWEYMVLRSTDNFCFGEVLRSSAWPQFFLNKEVRVMLLVLFCDLLDAFSAHIVNIIEQKIFTAWSTNTSHSQQLYRGITRPYCPAPTLPLRVWKAFLHCRRGSASPCEGVWSTRPVSGTYYNIGGCAFI